MGNDSHGRAQTPDRAESTWSASGSASGLAGWLLARFRRMPRSRPRLMVRERIALAPRQYVALIEADGRRFLIATAGDGTPAFHPLDAPAKTAQSRRISW